VKDRDLKKEFRTFRDDTPEGVDPLVYLLFCEDATRFDQIPDNSRHKTLLAWNPWIVPIR
jgi:hypothetical protein